MPLISPAEKAAALATTPTPTNVPRLVIPECPHPKLKVQPVKVGSDFVSMMFFLNPPSMGADRASLLPCRFPLQRLIMSN
jgi:hypothetical protein